MDPLTGTLCRSRCGSVGCGEHLLSSTMVPAMLSAVGWSKNADGHELLSGGALLCHGPQRGWPSRARADLPIRSAAPRHAPQMKHSTTSPRRRLFAYPPPPPNVTIVVAVVVVIILNFCFCYSTDSSHDLHLLKYGHLHREQAILWPSYTWYILYTV